jgi:hypothetical protein
MDDAGQSEPEGAAMERTEGQRRYDEVAEHEEQIRRLLDEIPRDATGRRRAVCRALDTAETYLTDAVAELARALEAMQVREDRT